MNKDAKYYLKQIEKLSFVIKQKEELIEEIRASLGAQAISYSKDMSTSQGDPNSIERRYTKLVTIEMELEEDVCDLIQLKYKISNVINELDDSDQVKLLTLRYVNLVKPWEKIAVEMNYSLRNIHIIHSNALKAINEKLKTFH